MAKKTRFTFHHFVKQHRPGANFFDDFLEDAHQDDFLRRVKTSQDLRNHLGFDIDDRAIRVAKFLWDEYELDPQKTLDDVENG